MKNSKKAVRCGVRYRGSDLHLRVKMKKGEIPFHNQVDWTEGVFRDEKTRAITLLLDHTSVGILTIEPDLKVGSEFSKSLLSILELEAHQVEGRDYEEILFKHSDLGREVLNSIRRSLEYSFSEEEVYFKINSSCLPKLLNLRFDRKDKYLTIEWMPVPAEDHGGIIKVLVSIKDETESEQLRQAMSLRTERLVSIGMQMASIAHELASPSQMIQFATNDLLRVHKELAGTIHTIFADNDDPDAVIVHRNLTQWLGDLSDTIHRIGVSSKRILDLQQAVKNQMQQRQASSSFDLRVLCEECLVISENRLAGLHVVLDIPKERSIEAIRSQVGQILTNLIDNAADAVRENLSADREAASPQLPDIRIHLDKGDGLHHRIVVSDRGGGVPPERVEKIFEPFFTTKSQGKGTGLGLHICKKIAREMGGDISYEPNPGLGGASFILKIPQLGGS